MPRTVAWKDALNGTREGWTYAGQWSLLNRVLTGGAGRPRRDDDKPERRRGRQAEEPERDDDEIGARIGEDMEVDDRWKSQEEQIVKLKVGQ